MLHFLKSIIFVSFSVVSFVQAAGGLNSSMIRLPHSGMLQAQQASLARTVGHGSLGSVASRMIHTALIGATKPQDVRQSCLVSQNANKQKALLQKLLQMSQEVDGDTMQQTNQAVSKVTVLLDESIGPVAVNTHHVNSCLAVQKGLGEQGFKDLYRQNSSGQSFISKLLFGAQSDDTTYQAGSFKLEIDDFAPQGMDDVDNVLPFFTLSAVDDRSESAIEIPDTVISFVENMISPAITKWGLQTKEKIQSELQVVVDFALQDAQSALVQQETQLRAEQKRMLLVLAGYALRTGVFGTICFGIYHAPIALLSKKILFAANSGLMLNMMRHGVIENRKIQQKVSELYLDTEISKWYVSGLKNVQYDDAQYCKNLVALCAKFLQRCQEIKNRQRKAQLMHSATAVESVYQPELPTMRKNLLEALKGLWWRK